MFPKETNEFIHALAVISLHLLKAGEDGLDFNDAKDLAARLIADAEFRDALTNGVKGAQNIPSEFKNISLVELIGKISEATKPV